jgi:hypothetical protein
MRQGTWIETTRKISTATFGGRFSSCSYRTLGQQNRVNSIIRVATDKFVLRNKLAS